MTIVTNPGTPGDAGDRQEGDKITKLDMQSGAQVEGVGTLIGSFYKLADGTVGLRAGRAGRPSGATPLPGATPTPGRDHVPTPTVTTLTGVDATAEASRRRRPATLTPDAARRSA